VENYRLWLRAAQPPALAARTAHPVPHHLPHPGRHGLVHPRRKRKICYPAHWAWETQQPFALAQVDVQDIRDEATLGPRLGHYLTQAHLPRYQ